MNLPASGPAPHRRVYFFATCLVDLMAPQAGLDAIALLRQAGVDWKEALAWRAWAWLNTHPRLYRWVVALARPLRGLTPPWQGGWTAHRTPLRLARHGLRERLAREGRR